MNHSPDVPREAIDTITAFLDANRRQDEEGMRACLSRRTLESGSFSGPDGHATDFFIGEPRRDGDRIVVPVRIVPPGAGEDSPESMDLPCIVVEEDGAFKFDLAGTMEIAFGGDLGDMVDSVAGAISEAMDGIGDALQTAFGSGGEECDGSDEVRWDDVALEPSAEEFLPLSPMTRLPITSDAVSRALGFDVPVEADIEGLLAPFGPEQREQLIDWFEQQVFAGWPGMLAEVNELTPLENRLRGVRIETASFDWRRWLAVDGHDLVYRIRLPDADGYYSAEELIEMLAGVLAGLPDAIDAKTLGHRLLPVESESPDVDAYVERVLPRHMRRICEKVGHHVALEANWDDLLRTTGDSLGLYHWSTGRVLGALALACTDADRREEISAGMHTVRLRFVDEPDERGAWYEGGVLEVALSPFRGETGCLYEHEIARALPGGEAPDF